MSELDFNILKTITTDNAKAMDFANNYDYSLFAPDYRSNVKLVLDYIRSYRAVPTKRTLISRYAETPEQLKEISDFWEDIENHEYDLNEYTFDVENLKERFKQHTVKSMSAALGEKMSQGLEPDVILKDIALKLQKTSVLNHGRTHIQKSVGDYVDEFKDRYASKKNLDIESPEVKTGFSMLDSVTGGLAPAELIVIGGESNSGKSQLLLNMAVQMWMQENTVETPPDEFKRGYNVLYFSLEMPYEDCFNRFMAKLADIPERGIKDSALNTEQYKKMQTGLEFVQNYQKAGYYFNIVDVPRNVTIEEIELRYQDALLEFAPDIVVVDYMGLMHNHAMAKEPDWLKMGAIAASLHEFSRAYNIIMLTAVQLTDIKRGSKNKGEQEEHQRVGMHRIGRSSHIAHHLNVCLQIESRLNEQSLPDLRYHVIKNRKGPLGQGNMIKNFEHSSVYDVPFIDNLGGGENISANIPELIRKIRDSNEG